MNHLDGPAPTSDKLLYDELRKRGAKLAIPGALRNTKVAKSKKGPVGAIVVRKMTGVVDNSASRITRRFEENVGGLSDVAEKLEAVPDRLNAAEKQLLSILKTPTKKGLSRLIAESGAEPTSVMRKYAEGCVELGKIEAAMEAHRHLPALIKRLYKLALTEYGVCGACGGTGTLHRKATDQVETLPCTFCESTGLERPSKLAEFAARQLLEVTKQVGTEKGITVNTAVGVKVEGGNGASGSVFEKVMNAADEVLYRRDRESPMVIDVQPISSQSE